VANSPLISFRRAVTLALFTLVQRRENPFLAAVFFLQLGQAGGDAFQFGLQLSNGFLLFGEVAGDDERLGDEVAGPALVLLLTLSCPYR
jgi:hypothetical protein